MGDHVGVADVGDRSGGPTGTAQATSDPFEDGSLDVPNCPACLHPMEAAGAPTGGVYWQCSSCGQTRLS